MIKFITLPPSRYRLYILSRGTIIAQRFFIDIDKIAKYFKTKYLTVIHPQNRTGNPHTPFVELYNHTHLDCDKPHSNRELVNLSGF